ncbi:acetyltransferase [Piscirickettsia salmonis]|uniref:GNAT family N-acetyltransferase n=1 Tax=Piscirickettsia salmonis TaxID=1238 RepID=UPI000332CA65|nr:GNAT family N-acetyltransferase [Piscirickettsia salmonis]ALA25787.1 acetyltransferase [Piscirickettsia salmonis]APS43270.1 acetyltransferase [Piscirickettsia salmonis]APS46619.1 acetyltransferase [Piscirickettsia salmonis]APS50596.1 acetyltransferase [Piscirickettsia salmonis]APS53799.1 acetyltransferase [Piscirickettsia salmonis]
MDIYIRGYESNDAEDLHRIFSQKSVYSNTFQLPTPSLDKIIAKYQQRLEHNNQYSFVAVDKQLDQVIGESTISIPDTPRRSHSASFGIIVDENYRGQGIGSLLTCHVIDFCFNWLGKIRIELEVYSQNQAAIALYEKHGFKIEGHCKNYALYQGKYTDGYLMAKLKED